VHFPLCHASINKASGFNCGYEPLLDTTSSPVNSYVEIDGLPPAEPDRCNVWPDAERLPHFKSRLAAYYGEVLSLARHLFRLFALSLELEESYFDKLTTHPGGIFRLLYYPPQSPETFIGRKDRLGLGAHTDYECFTILLSTPHPGLEILFPPSPLTDNKPIWRPCPIKPGALTVNIADFLMRWTNGVYKSTIHRVVSRPVKESVNGKEVLRGSEARYSVPFFFSINYDADVEPLPETAVGVSRFQNLKAGAYVLERLRATT
jgi:isopenicillin N synthase-like dioxygenase